MARKALKWINIDVLLVLILGLTPLLWYPSTQHLALGHDLVFPLNPIAYFRDRLFLWTERAGLGINQSPSVGGLFIHGFEAFLAYLGFPLQAVQKITFIFWFTTPGLAMYYLISSLNLKKRSRFFPLIASLFYMFNHFLLQGWFIAERTKFSAMVALPLVLAFLIRGLEKRLSWLKAAILINLVLFIFNSGGGFGFPLYGGLIIGSVICLIYFTLLQWRKIGVRAFFEVLPLIFLTLFLYGLLNFYWLLPFARFVSKSYSQSLASGGGVEGILSWTRVISEHTSFINLFRLQGFSEWYENPLHPYANLFLKNPILIFLSFIWSLLAFASLLLARKKEEKKYVLFFNLLVLVAMIFAAGTHPPTGFIYTFLVKYIPFFPIFRTPFYKFSYLIWFAYAFLIGFSVDALSRRWIGSKLRGNLKTLIPIFFSLAFIVFILLYNFPFFTASFFKWNPPLSTMVKVPSYVFEFGEWMDSLTRDERVLMLPPLNRGGAGYADAYKWNYWSRTTVPSLLTQKPVIGNSAELNSEQRALVDFLYSALWERDETLAKKLMGLLNIKYLLLRQDVFYDLDWSSTTSPEEWQNRLKSFNWLRLENEFGEWLVFHSETNEFLSHFYLPQSYSFTDKGLKPLIPFSFSEFDSKETIFSLRENGLPLDLADKIYILAQPYPERKKEMVDIGLARFLPGGRLYPLIRWKEKFLEKKIKATGDPEKMLNLNLGLANKRLREIKGLIEKRGRIKKEISLEVNDDISLIESELKSTPEMMKIERLIKETYERFDERIDKILEILKDSEHQEESVSKAKLRFLEYLEIWQDQLFYLLRDDDLYADASTRLQGLLSLKQEFEDETWVTRDELENRYFFEAPRKGEYELFIYTDKAEEDVDYPGEMFKKPPFIPSGVIIDGEIVTISGEKREDDWQSFGKCQLREGRHKLQVFWPDSINLVRQENFTISARGVESWVLPLDEFLEGGQSFNFSFDFRVEGRDMPRLIVVQRLLRGENEYVSRAIDTFLPKSEYELKFSKSFTIDPKAKQAGIKLFFENYGDSRVIVKDLRLTRDWRPEIVFRNEMDRDVFLKTPKISFQRINSTKYEVWIEEVKEPYLLMFLESFDPDWKVYSEEADPIPQERHLLVNGYANSWYIKPEDFGGNKSYQLTVEFWPQRLFYIGILISGVSLLGCLGYLGVLGIGNFGRKENYL